MEYYLVRPAYESNEQYCIEHNINLMLSYYNDKKVAYNKFLKYREERIEKGLPNGKLFMDSGAFTAWTKGVVLKKDEYVDYINKYRHLIDHFGQMDSIPNENSYEAVKKAADDTWKNYLELVEAVKYPEKITYTFHVGEPIENLIEALKWGSEHKDVMKLIALGGMVRKNKVTKESFIIRSLAEVKKYYPEVKVHLFGTTSDIYFKKYNAYSGDSSNYIKTATTGGVDTPYGTIGFGEKKDKNHYTVLTTDKKKVIDDYFKSINVNPEDLLKAAEHRLTANIIFIENKYFKNRSISYIKGKKNTALF